MRIFNLENADRGTPTAKQECVVIGRWEEWQLIIDTLDAELKRRPKLKKLAKIIEDLESLAVY